MHLELKICKLIIVSVVMICIVLHFTDCQISFQRKKTILKMDYERYDNKSKLLHQLLEKKRYSRHRLPPNPPVAIGIGLHILTLSGLDESSGHYELSVLLSEKWDDVRLINNMSKTEDISFLSNRLWVPATIFYNSKFEYEHTVKVSNEVVRLQPNGTLLRISRVSLHMTCALKLQDYPFDEQNCTIRLQSFGPLRTDVKYYWRNVTRTGEDYMAEFKLPEVRRLRDCSNDLSEDDEMSMPCLEVVISLTRERSFYIISHFCPTTIIVVISWASFWLDVGAVPARVTLGLITVLTLITQTSSTSRSGTHVSYLRAVDVWDMCCVFFAAAALLEFTAANFLHRRGVATAAAVDAEKQTQELTPMTSPEKMNDALLVPTNTTNVYRRRKMEEKHKTKKNYVKSYMKSKIKSKRKVSCPTCDSYLDRISRICFPLAFTFVQIIYWIYYLARV